MARRRPLNGGCEGNTVYWICELQGFDHEYQKDTLPENVRVQLRQGGQDPGGCINALNEMKAVYADVPNILETSEVPVYCVNAKWRVLTVLHYWFISVYSIVISLRKSVGAVPIKVDAFMFVTNFAAYTACQLEQVQVRRAPTGRIPITYTKDQINSSSTSSRSGIRSSGCAGCQSSVHVDLGDTAVGAGAIEH
ncbi:hypothetical protein PC120_g12160 [Phytophthora cactorum]|nr:hypothetical protein PC120_g12160 [Phytophthora cactorum]